MSAIPLVDLKAQHAQVADEVARGFAGVIDDTAFIQGKEVVAFERAFADFSGIRHCLGVANGTDALELAVRALGIGRDDEVIVPANTFIATVLAVSRAGATPVFVDSDPVYHLIDPTAVAQRLTRRTRAVLAVHLFGQVAPIEGLQAAIAGRDIALLEDAAQAQGAKRGGVIAGGFGRVTGTSFYPGKNLGAYGDAGAVLTNDDEVAKTIAALRNYGSAVKYYHPETGFNSRLDTLQAVVLSAKLKHLARWNASRRVAAARYDELLTDVPSVTLPRTLEGNEHIWHLYVIRVARRDEILKRLHASGVGAGIHYPVPCHLQGAFRHLGHTTGDFPVAEQAADEILSLPMFPEITPDQQSRVVEALRAALI